MNRLMFAKRLAIVCLVAKSGLAWAGSSILEMGWGARAAALGSAYSALAGGTDALHWNPAGLGTHDRREWSGSHAELAAGTRHEFVGYSRPAGKFAWGAGASYLHHEAIEGRAVDGSQTGSFRAQDLLVVIGGARALAPGFRLGIGVKVLRSEIADARATGFAADLGSRWDLTGGRLQLALGAQNLGPKIQYAGADEDLPSSVSAGAGYRAGMFLFSADARRELSRVRNSLHFGAELSPASFLSLRGGYLLGSGSSSPLGAPRTSPGSRLENLSGLGLGLGFRAKSARLDYAFTPAGELGNVQRLSLSVRY